MNSSLGSKTSVKKTKMKFLETTSFKLAIYAKGNENADKLALVLPGQLDTKDYPHMRSHVDSLAGLGYFALSFDPTGTWESSGDISQYTMTNYLKAIDELIEHFGKKPTFAMGHSRGGAMAMLAGITNPSVKSFACVMSNYTYDPVLNPSYDSLHDVNEWKTKGFKESWRDLPDDPSKKRLFKLPYSFIEDQRQYDMLDGLKKCTKPKLFIYGAHDELIKPEVVKYEFDVAADPKQIYELDSDHDYRRHPELIEKVNKLVGEFLRTSVE